MHSNSASRAAGGPCFIHFTFIVATDQSFIDSSFIIVVACPCFVIDLAFIIVEGPLVSHPFGLAVSTSANSSYIIAIVDQNFIMDSGAFDLNLWGSINSSRTAIDNT